MTTPALPRPAESQHVQEQVSAAFEAYKNGGMQPTELAERILAAAASPAIDGVHIDTDRARRCGFPEVIYAEGKRIDALLGATERVFATLPSGTIDELLITRISVDQARYVAENFANVAWDATSRTMRVGRAELMLDPDTIKSKVLRKVNVVCAGTADLPVALEARQTLAWMGVGSRLIADVGVAGLYRVLGQLEILRDAAALVVVAGMEGALPSVLGGLVDIPIIAVPTSVGYGANLQGIAALLSMLNSCSANIAVVNIDAGFKAAFMAGLIARQK